MTEPEPIDPSQIRPGPIRHKTLSPELLEQIRAIYDVIGSFLKMNLEEFEISFMRDSSPEIEVNIWMGITAAWIDYHERFLDDELLPVDEEGRLIAALIAISTGVEDISKLGVSEDVGQGLLDCFDELIEEDESDTDE